jgi:squalene synthase HpnC
MVSNADARPQLAGSELARIAVTSRAKITAENFPVALRVLPRRPRDLLTRAYAFARFVDDVGDTAGGDRLALLDAVTADVQALPSGTSALEPVAGMAPLVHDCGLGLQPLLDLVEANRRDQVITRYETFDDLLDYCRYSAAPVGRMVLAVFGVRDPVAAERSDRVCSALQVLEHCQDVGEDAAAGRVYLPAVDLHAAGVDAAQLHAADTAPRLRQVIALQVDRAAGLLEDGPPLVRSLHGWARLAVLGYVAGGRATVDALRGGAFDVLAGHLAPSTGSTMWHAARLAVGR